MAEAYIVAATRTAGGRKGGRVRGWHPSDLGGAVLNDLLDLAKAQAGKTTVRTTDFEVASLFGALRGVLKPLLINQSVSLIFEEPAPMPMLETDESKVSQILRNFISNALKFTERGQITVSARHDAAEPILAAPEQILEIGGRLAAAPATPGAAAIAAAGTAPGATSAAALIAPRHSRRELLLKPAPRGCGRPLPENSIRRPAFALTGGGRGRFPQAPERVCGAARTPRT